MPRILKYAATLAVFSIATTASAQPAPRVEIAAATGFFAVDADAVTGGRPAAGASVRVRLTPHLSLEGEVWRPAGPFRREFTAPSIAFAPPPVTPDQFVITQTTIERRVQALVSAGVVLHPAQPIGRFTPRLFAGLTAIPTADRWQRTHIALPPGVTLAQAYAAIAPQERQTRVLSAFTIGATLAIHLTDRLSVAPDVRFDYGSIGDEINNSFRSSMKLLWAF